MPRPRRAPFVALTTLLSRRCPDAGDARRLITDGLVLVDGAPVVNPAARVRADAALRVLRPRPLRGTAKLAFALESFAVPVAGRVALDIGAAAGGFTQALLDAGAARVYALDAGFGQLRGHLVADARVVNLERTNLGRLDRSVIREPVDLVTMDLSYLSVADAGPQLDPALLSAAACLLALVKPTYELHAPRLAAAGGEVAAAVALARSAVERAGWRIRGARRSPVTGRRGAVEVFVWAERSVSGDGPR
jgi:23S rRNA (cytidine1920-2'-O)/16S rRNA (cytidine1409-2'-O)-methyltransferase